MLFLLYLRRLLGGVFCYQLLPFPDVYDRVSTRVFSDSDPIEGLIGNS
jgi:hypothetical protein